jgi:hypothetical protein
MDAPQPSCGTHLKQREKYMKNLTKALATTFASVLVLGAAWAGGDSAWYDAPTLVGTWQFEMTVRLDAADCTNSEPIAFGPNPFPALASFHEGGTMSEYASRTPPSVRTTGFGSWKQTGRYRYKSRHTFMEFDPNGLLWRTMVIESNIRLANDGDKYNAVGRLALTDVSGNVVNLCATIEGVRFKP